MIQKTKPIEFANVPFGKIKGHTRIELTDVKTGKKKVIEHDNVFQNIVLSSFLRSLGQADNSPFANSTFNGLNLYRALCGGILLFKDPIDDSNIVEYAPAGNQMIANGAFDVTNTGNPLELGSYNSVESSFSYNSATFVYDWDTSHGNGNISCVCLTSEIGGYIGYGNASGAASSTLKYWTANQSAAAVLGTSNINRDIHGNMRYEFNLDRTNKILSVTKTKLALTTASLFAKKSDTIQIPINYTFYTGTWGDTMNVCCGLDGKFRIFIPTGQYGQQVTAGNDIVFIEYNPADDTAVMRTVTNTTGVTLRSRGRTYCDGTYLYIGKDGTNYIEAHPIYAIRLSDSATMGNWNAAGGNVDGLRSFIALGAGYMLVESSSTNINGLWIWDVANDTIRLTNGRSAGGTDRYRTDNSIDANVSTGSSSSGHLIYKNPLYLATINNLDNVVVKDATNNMKVIYTLTEIEI